MSSRVYVGGLPRGVRERDLERFFKGYGRIREILLKNGYGFVEFEDHRDADDAIYELDGEELLGRRIVVEQAKGAARGVPKDRYDSRRRGHYNDSNPRNSRFGPPQRTEHRLIVENLSSSVSWQDLKDYVRQAGEVTYCDAHKEYRNEGVVEFATRADMKAVIDKLDDTDLKGRRIRLVEDRTVRHGGGRGRERSRSRSDSRRRSRGRSRRSTLSRSKSRSRGRRSKSRSVVESRSRSHSPKPRSRSDSGSRLLSQVVMRVRSLSKSRKESAERNQYKSPSRSKAAKRKRCPDSRSPDSRSRSPSRGVKRACSLLKSRRESVKCTERSRSPSKPCRDSCSRERSGSRHSSRSRKESRSHSRSSSRSRWASPGNANDSNNGDEKLEQ